MYHSKGIGRALFDYVIKYKKENGYDRIELSVNSQNHRAKEIF